ncbi:MAG TPA: hypothetical protein VEJ63_22750 [Planctomycetota bacterium]|nr:hypothetical protein [Planctomycetota bacterium]
MEVNKLESREVLVILFGLPVMVTLIVLASIGVGHLVTTRSDRPTNVTVSAATPKVDVNVPQAPTPQINVSAATPKIDVNVPQVSPPAVNVTTPPAVVTVLDRRAEETERPDDLEQKLPSPADVKKQAPNSAEPPKATPVSAPAEKTSLKTPALREEDLTLDTLYKYAEGYIHSYCKKNNLDPAAETKKWNERWKQRVEQSIADGTDSSEQTFINRTVVAKRSYFDLEKATPEQIVEGCRIMLRYRDGQFAWLQAMKDAVTQENMKKTLVFLAAGVR